MSPPLLEDMGGGRFRLAGVLDFSTVDRALRDRGLAAFGSKRGLILDLAGVTRANSAGLALLLEWLDQAASGNLELRFTNLPASLTAIARMSNVEDLLPVVQPEN